MSYICSVCKAAFDTREEAVEHFLAEHGPIVVPEEAKFVCPVCGLAFYYRINLDQHMKAEHPDEPLPRACIIATVFLGENHPFLIPMRKFRDKFIPKVVMEGYYSSSVFVLRKIGKIKE